MAYLGFFKEFQHRRALADTTQNIRNVYSNTNQEISQKIIDVYKENAPDFYKQAKEYYSNENGLPTAESSAEKKKNFAEFMLNARMQFDKPLKEFADSLAASHYKEVTDPIRQAVEQKRAPFSESEIEEAISRGWGNDKIETGIMSVFEETADARATALGITRFRGTDGAMGFLGSTASLLYKDNEHLSGKGKAALWGGGLTGAGTLVGLGYSVSN